MKLTINRDELANIVTSGVSSAPKNSPSAILNNARVIVRDGTMSIASTDLEMMTEATGACAMEAAGAVTIDAAKLKTTVDRLPKGVDVKIEYDKSKYSMIMKAGRSRITFPSLAAEDWPARDQNINGAKFNVSGADLVRLFSHTVSVADPRPGSHVAGVFFHVRETKSKPPALAAVGTTGLILILATVDLPKGADAMPMKDGATCAGVVLSQATVNAVLRLFRNAEKVTIEVDASAILFSTDTVRFSSSLLVSTYPNYAPLIDNPSEANVLVDRACCASAVNLLESFTSADSGNRFQCAASEEGLVLAVGGTEGNGVDVVDAEIEGEFDAFGINGAFLKTMLNSFRSENVVLHPDTKARRVVFLAESEPDLIGAIAMMNITTELATGPANG